MDTILEPGSRVTKLVNSNIESSPSIGNLRHFALQQLGFRLSTDPDLVAACWAQIGTVEERPDLTVLYCSLRWLGRRFAFLEFVAGETLEELVKRSDPAACEREIPLFCRILDAFENSTKKANAEPASFPGLELLDFGIGRASASLTSKFHGGVLTGSDGTMSDEVCGEYGGSRSQVFAALMELCSRLPGELPRAAGYGSVSLSGVTVSSLGIKVAPAELVLPGPPPDSRGAAARKRAIPSLIAVLTALLILLALYGVGGILAKRTVPPDAGKLVLPAVAPETMEPPLEVPAPRDEPAPATTKKPPAANKTRSAKRPVASIVLARGARPIRQTSLLYPVLAQKEHVTGVVEMQLTIAEDGSVQSPRVVSGDPLLRAGLTEEISTWVYQPLRVNGKPVPMTTELAIRFNLN
jgi:Periplasmic protein TonB, links inner and outer membranes